MFGERLQQLRSQRDMKQAVLAKRLGVSRSAINAWENGISFPSLANLFELCHVFGTTPDYLLGFSSEHCVDISALTPSQQEMVMRLIHCFEEQNDMQKAGRCVAHIAPLYVLYFLFFNLYKQYIHL